MKILVLLLVLVALSIGVGSAVWVGGPAAWQNYPVYGGPSGFMFNEIYHSSYGDYWYPSYYYTPAFYSWNYPTYHYYGNSYMMYENTVYSPVYGDWLGYP